MKGAEERKGTLVINSLVIIPEPVRPCPTCPCLSRGGPREQVWILTCLPCLPQAGAGRDLVIGS